DLPTHRSILAQQLLEPEDNGPMAMVATLYLAIVTRRVREGHEAELQSGQLRSLIDHPVAAAAARIAAAVEKDANLSLGDAVVPHEEVGFLTMYLAGSLERNRLRPKIRITVVCPAGMATAWILVSRLSAEFPNIEITRVVSKTVFEKDVDLAATDLVVSTIPLDELGA